MNYVRNSDGDCTHNCTETAKCEKCDETDIREAEDSKIHSYENGFCTICGEGYATQGLEYELNDDGKSYSVSGRGTATDKEVYIPATYKGLPVTGITGYAFGIYPSLKSIFIGVNIKSIGTQVFLSGTLENIFVAENNEAYKSIDGNLYSRDGSVLLRYPAGKKQASFTIPEGVVSIGEEAFRSCTLEGIVIPETVTKICDRALYECDGLACVTVSENNGALKSVDGNLFSKDGTVLYLYCSGKEEASFAVPEGVKTICGYAFNNCRNLLSITLPAGVEEIGEGAFYNCISITTMTIYAGIESIADKTFYNCNSLVSVFLPAGLKSIGEYAFLGCIRLKNITVPDGVEEIGMCAFLACSGIETVTIPKSVKVICYDAFSSCNSIKTVYYEGTEAEWRNIEIVGGNTLLTDANIHFTARQVPSTMDKLKFKT